MRLYNRRRVSRWLGSLRISLETEPRLASLRPRRSREAGSMWNRETGTFVETLDNWIKDPANIFGYQRFFFALVQIAIKVPSRTRPRVTPPTYPQGPAPV